MKLTRKKFSTK